MRRTILFLLFAVSACGHSNYARSVYGTVGGYSMKNVNPKPISLMVARKVSTPLYIVINDTNVKDTWQIETAACAIGSRGCERFKLMDVQQFVRRDLKAALEKYFQRVEVVESSQVLPSTKHIVGDVKIDDIRLHSLVRWRLTHELIQMKWAFALRWNDQESYFYSFAGTATSNDSYPTFEAGCAQLVENAIPAVLKKWIEKGGVAALLDAK